MNNNTSRILFWIIRWKYAFRIQDIKRLNIHFLWCQIDKMRSHKNDIKRLLYCFFFAFKSCVTHVPQFIRYNHKAWKCFNCMYLRFITLSAIAALNNIKVIGYYYRYRITLKSLWRIQKNIFIRGYIKVHGFTLKKYL